MATTSLWKVEARLDKVIKYTTNEEKTTNVDFEKDLYKSLHNTIEYAKADFKTERIDKKHLQVTYHIAEKKFGFSFE